MEFKKIDSDKTMEGCNSPKSPLVVNSNNHNQNSKNQNCGCHPDAMDRSSLKYVSHSFLALNGEIRKVLLKNGIHISSEFIYSLSGSDSRENMDDNNNNNNDDSDTEIDDDKEEETLPEHVDPAGDSSFVDKGEPSEKKTKKSTKPKQKKTIEKKMSPLSRYPTSDKNNKPTLHRHESSLGRSTTTAGSLSDSTVATSSGSYYNQTKPPEKRKTTNPKRKNDLLGTRGKRPLVKKAVPPKTEKTNENNENNEITEQEERFKSVLEEIIRTILFHESAVCQILLNNETNVQSHLNGLAYSLGKEKKKNESLLDYLLHRNPFEDGEEEDEEGEGVVVEEESWGSSGLRFSSTMQTSTCGNNNNHHHNTFCSIAKPMEEKKRCFSWDGSSSPQNNNNQNSSPKSPVKLEWNSPTRTPSPVLKSTDVGLVENATPHRKSSSFHYLESETILASTCPSKLMTLVGTANENMKEDEKEDGKCSSSEASLSNRTLPPPKENPKTNQNDSCTRRRHTTEEEASLPQQKKKSVNVHPNRSNSFTNGFDLEKYNSRPITDENKNNQHRHQSERRPTPEDYEKLQRSVQDTEQRSLRILKRIKLLKTEEEALRGHLHRLSLKQQKLLSVLPAVRRTTSQHYIHGASSRFAGDSSIFRHSHTTHNNNNNHNVDSHTNSNGDTVTVNVPNSNPNTNPNTHHQHYYFTETDPNNNSENDADGRTNSNGDSYKIVDPSIYAHYAYQSLRLDNNNHNNIEGHFPPPTKPQAPLTFYDLLQPFYSSDNNNSNEISKNEISDENEECSNHHHNHDKSHHSPPRKEGAVRLYTSHGGRKEDVMTELNFRQSERTE